LWEFPASPPCAPHHLGRESSSIEAYLAPTGSQPGGCNNIFLLVVVVGGGGGGGGGGVGGGGGGGGGVGGGGGCCLVRRPLLSHPLFLPEVTRDSSDSKQQEKNEEEEEEGEKYRGEENNRTTLLKEQEQTCLESGSSGSTSTEDKHVKEGEEREGGENDIKARVRHIRSYLTGKVKTKPKPGKVTRANSSPLKQGLPKLATAGNGSLSWDHLQDEPTQRMRELLDTSKKRRKEERLVRLPVKNWNERFQMVLPDACLHCVY